MSRGEIKRMTRTLAQTYRVCAVCFLTTICLWSLVIQHVCLKHCINFKVCIYCGTTTRQKRQTKAKENSHTHVYTFTGYHTIYKRK